VNLIKHWQAMLGDKIFIVHQCDLINQQAKTTAQLLQYIELPWQDNCLNFQHNKNVVHTLSNIQVRQQPSAKFIQQWLPYKAQLTEVIELLTEAGLSID
jgi:hypothetical protein